MPKAELHLHIEGTLEPELMLALGARNGVRVPYADADEARAAYRFADLRSFCNLYYRGMAVLRTRAGLLRADRRLPAPRARPTAPATSRSSSTRRATSCAACRSTRWSAASRAALADGERALGISSRLIMCFLRDESPRSALEVLDAGARHIAT